MTTIFLAKKPGAGWKIRRNGIWYDAPIPASIPVHAAQAILEANAPDIGRVEVIEWPADTRPTDWPMTDSSPRSPASRLCATCGHEHSDDGICRFGRCDCPLLFPAVSPESAPRTRNRETWNHDGHLELVDPPESAPHEVPIAPLCDDCGERHWKRSPGSRPKPKPEAAAPHETPIDGERLLETLELAEASQKARGNPHNAANLRVLADRLPELLAAKERVDVAEAAARRLAQDGLRFASQAESASSEVKRLTEELATLTGWLAVKRMELGEVPDPRIGTASVDIRTIMRDRCPSTPTTHEPLPLPESLTPHDPTTPS